MRGWHSIFQYRGSRSFQSLGLAMGQSGQRRVLVIVGPLLIGVILLVGLYTYHSKKFVTALDASYDFTFWRITQGTNHTVYAGIPALGLINRTLIRSVHGTITRDQQFSWTTLEPATCLYVGFRYHADRSGAAVKRDPKSGLFYPEDNWLLKSVLVLQNGKAMELPQSDAGYGLYKEQYVNSWEVPSSVSNLAGCEVRLSRKKDGASVATFTLQ